MYIIIIQITDHDHLILDAIPLYNRGLIGSESKPGLVCFSDPCRLHHVATKGLAIKRVAIMA